VSVTSAPDHTTATSRARAALTEQLFTHGGVAVLRLPRADDAFRAIEALREGGVMAIEVTVTTPGALAIIAETASRLPDVLVGVGSVLDVETARRAVDAGAKFVVSPIFKPEIVAEAHRLGVPAGPGAFTPTEALRAHEAGADVVKIFPADTLGIAFLKGVLAPMPFLRLMPTGGVTPENAGDWLRAGAACVGLGGALIDPKLVAAGDFAALTARARRLMQSVAAARDSSGGAS
jgi:2-dehydro-3-deoxyphosphogluconate aldolase/(4S)-4-hydroxy-2-oxoglutarate aldolase